MCKSLLDRLLPSIAWATAYIARRDVTGLCGVVSYSYDCGGIDVRERNALRLAIDAYTLDADCGYVAIHLLRDGARDDLWFAHRAMLWQRWAIDLVRQVQKELYGHG